MASSVLALVALAATLVSCVAGAPVMLKSISPPKVMVTVTGFMVDGQKMAAKTSKSADLNAPGIPTLQADMDSVMVGYSTPPSAVPGVTSTSVYACYSKASAYDRPWRKADDNLAKDKSCSIQIGHGLPPHEGNTTWKIGENVPQATYYVRAYSMCGATICAFGNSTGYFQVNAVDNRPPQVVGAAIGVMFFGPVVLCLFFFGDRLKGKGKTISANVSHGH